MSKRAVRKLRTASDWAIAGQVITTLWKVTLLSCGSPLVPERWCKARFKDGVNRETVGCDYDVWLYEIAPVQLREATVNSKRGSHSLWELTPTLHGRVRPPKKEIMRSISKGHIKLHKYPPNVNWYSSINCYLYNYVNIFFLLF